MGYSGAQFRTSVCMCVCNTLTVYGLRDNSKNIGAISSNFLWTLSGLLVSMSLHLDSVALPEVLRWEIQALLLVLNHYQ